MRPPALPAGDVLPLSRLLDESVRLLRLHFRTIVPPVAVPLALLSAVGPLAQIAIQHLAPRAASLEAWVWIAGAVSFALLAIAFLAVYVLGYGALMAAAMDAAAGRSVEMRRAWRTMLRPRVLGTLVLAGLAVALGFLLCIVPGAYLGLLWCVVVPVMLEESRHGTAALSRSAELMRHNPVGGLANAPRARAFLLVVAGALLGYAVSTAVQLPLMGLMGVAMLREVAAGQRADPQRLNEMMLWLQVPMQVLSTAVNVAVQLFSALGLSLLYFDTRRRKEGGDLAAAIARLARPPAPPPLPPR